MNVNAITSFYEAGFCSSPGFESAIQNNEQGTENDPWTGISNFEENTHTTYNKVESTTHIFLHEM